MAKSVVFFGISLGPKSAKWAEDTIIFDIHYHKLWQFGFQRHALQFLPVIFGGSSRKYERQNWSR